MAKTDLVIPVGSKFGMIAGETFVQLKAAAKLAGIHPVVLEMGQRLLKQPDSQGAAFDLATPEMLKRADDIEAMFVKGLKKVAGAFGSTPMNVKSYRDDKNRLVFWYVPKIGRAARA